MALKLKVCGMKFADNINAVSALVPDYMGFIFYDKSKRFVDDIDSKLISSLPTAIKSTGVFVNQNLKTLIEIVNKYNLKAVQLHGAESVDYCAALKQQSPGIEIIKAFGVNEAFNFDLLKDYAPNVDYFLFDTQTPEHGGSGKTFNWQVLQEYKLEVPYFLSGGIGPEQVSDIHKIMDPRLYAIDVNSRFETAAATKNIETLTTFKNQLLGPAQ